MLEFQRGNADHPTGNLMVYCHVHGHNPVQPGGDLIVCNVVVSYVSARSNHFPVVIFPPTALPAYDDLENLLELSDNYDLVQLEDFEIPGDQDEDSYVRERLDVFNRYVMEYVELCREHIQEQIGRQNPSDMNRPAREIRELPDLRPEQAARGDADGGSPEDDLRLLGGASQSGASRDDASGEERSRGRGRGIKIARFRGDEASALDYLESWIDSTESVPAEMPDELNRVIHFIASNYPRYDIHNFQRILNRGKPDLPKLYLQKFRAIYTEEYEQAAEIQSTIRRLEKS
ncbi:MAG: hypothetical protein NXI24_13740 [bacterium]|nr:hypothetical protein [bacterium]